MDKQILCITILVIIIIASMIFIGVIANDCNPKNEKVINLELNSDNENRFEVLDKWETNIKTIEYIIYDKKTGVEYYKTPDSITVLYDKEGKPLIHSN